MCFFEEIDFAPMEVASPVTSQAKPAFKPHAQFSYEDDEIRKLVHNLVMNVAVDHFQEMFFPLLLYSKFEDNQTIMVVMYKGRKLNGVVSSPATPVGDLLSISGRE